MTDCSKIRIQLRDGAIYASKQGDIIRARGVRYARATRFQPPQPIEPWAGIVDCTSPASICPQLPSRLEALNGPITAGHAMSEDCLHVSVCAPATTRPETTPATLLPVIAFLHGGGYTSGGGDLDVYSGADLAGPAPPARSPGVPPPPGGGDPAVSSGADLAAPAAGVVYVGITYRLGILGYQPIQGTAPGNLGLLDQMAALRWIRDNVGSFGGDAQQITLAGASAGADSIYCLFAADGGETLFRRAILQSAPLGVRRMDRGAMVEALDHAAQDALGGGGGGPVDAAATPDELLRVQKKLALASRGFEALLMPFAPTLGHAPLCISESEFTARVQRALERIPLFIGYCRDEGVAFEAIFNGIHSDARPAIPTTTTSSVVDLISRSWFQDDADRLWEETRAAGGDPWFYELAVAPAGSPFKAAHTMEMAFILGGWDAWKNAPMLKGSDAEALVKTVGAEVKKLWVAFARGEDLGRTRFRIDEHFQI
ncbi:hypothetical protein MY4824_005307 [Beauveria thailandica]